MSGKMIIVPRATLDNVSIAETISNNGPRQVYYRPSSPARQWPDHDEYHILHCFKSNEITDCLLRCDMAACAECRKNELLTKTVVMFNCPYSELLGQSMIASCLNNTSVAQLKLGNQILVINQNTDTYRILESPLPAFLRPNYGSNQLIRLT